MDVKHIDYISPYTGKPDFIEFTTTLEGIYYRRKSYPEGPDRWQFQPFLLPMFAPLFSDLVSKAKTEKEFLSILTKYGPAGYYKYLDLCGGI